MTQTHKDLENNLRSQVENIESTHPEYDEYRYSLDEIGHKCSMYWKLYLFRFILIELVTSTFLISRIFCRNFAPISRKPFFIVSAKYSCGFPDSQVSFCILR